MREIVERLTENRQLEKAKSILESNGYKVSKKSKDRRLNESSLVSRLPKGTQFSTLADQREVMKDGTVFEPYNEEVHDNVAKLLNAPEDKIYFISYFDEDDIVDLYYDIAEEDYTELKYVNVKREGEEDWDEFSATIYLNKLNSTGELFVEVVTTEGRYGDPMTVYFIVDK